MKKIMLMSTTIILTTLLCVVPFSVTRAVTTFTEYSSSDFDYGHYTVYYFENSNGYVITDMFNFVNVPQQWESCIVNEVNFDNYYDGTITMNFAGNINTNLWQCYLESDGAYITNLTSTTVTISLVHCQKFYLYGFCNNNNDMNLRPKSSQPFSYGSGGLSPYSEGTQELINYNRSIIHKFEYRENYNSTDSTHFNYLYSVDNLNSNSYIYKQSSNRAVKRVLITFDIDNYTGGNYYVFNFYVMSNSILNENSFNNLVIRTRDETSQRVYNVLYYKYQEYYKFEQQNQSIINLILYIPITNLSVYTGNTFTLDFVTFDINVRAIKFAYLGMVEALSSETDVVNPSSDIDQVNNDLNSVNQNIDTIEQDITSGFNDNINNIDLDDHDFFTGLTNTTNFFKVYVQDFYNNIGDIKALFIVPVIVTIMMIIAGWMF